MKPELQEAVDAVMNRVYPRNSRHHYLDRELKDIAEDVTYALTPFFPTPVPDAERLKEAVEAMLIVVQMYDPIMYSNEEIFKYVERL